MTQETLTSLISFVTLAINGAREITPAILEAKNLIASLFSSKIITIEQQKALHSYVDSLEDLHKVGVTPPSWQVQPNPTP